MRKIYKIGVQNYYFFIIVQNIGYPKFIVGKSNFFKVEYSINFLI